jgi:uncharacterized protein YcbX
MMTISHLQRFPLKSAAAQQLSQAEIVPEGIQYDRRLMIVDAVGKLISERQCARLCLIRQEALHGTLYLKAPRMPEMSMSMYNLHGEQRRVIIHGSECTVLDQGNEFAAWCSDFLGQEARLVAMSDHELRTRIIKGGRQITIASQDSSPIHVISQTALYELRGQIASRSRNAYSDVELDSFVSYRRFRPNIVIKGAMSPQEDQQWPILRLSTRVVLVPRKRTPRCSMLNIDPDTGARQEEPLSTLNALYDKDENGIPLFGMYCIPTDFGRIEVGDKVAVE